MIADSSRHSAGTNDKDVEQEQSRVEEGQRSCRLPPPQTGRADFLHPAYPRTFGVRHAQGSTRTTKVPSPVLGDGCRTKPLPAGGRVADCDVAGVASGGTARTNSPLRMPPEDSPAKSTLSNLAAVN